MTKHHKLRESAIEKYLVDKVKENGGLPLKWESPGNRGVPDRICIFPMNIVLFVECKTQSGKLSKLQHLQIKRLVDRNCTVYIIRSKSDVDNMVNYAMSLGKRKTAIFNAASLTTKKGLTVHSTRQG